MLDDPGPNIGDAVALEAAEALARDGAGKRLTLRREGAESLVFAEPPLDLELGLRKLSLAGGAFEARVFAQLFAYGAASISNGVLYIGNYDGILYAFGS